MKANKARKILIEFNHWRRSEGKYEEMGVSCIYSPLEIGDAIDTAIRALGLQPDED